MKKNNYFHIHNFEDLENLPFNEYDIVESIKYPKSSKLIIELTDVYSKFYIYGYFKIKLLQKGEVDLAQIIEDSLQHHRDTIPTDLKVIFKGIDKLLKIDDRSYTYFKQNKPEIITCFIYDALYGKLIDQLLLFDPNSIAFQLYSGKYNVNSTNDLIYNILLDYSKRLLKSKRKTLEIEIIPDDEIITEETYKDVPSNLDDMVAFIFRAIDALPNNENYTYRDISRVHILVAVSYVNIRRVIFDLWRMWDSNSPIMKWFEENKNITNPNEVCYYIIKTFYTNLILRNSLND